MGYCRISLSSDVGPIARTRLCDPISDLCEVSQVHEGFNAQWGLHFSHSSIPSLTSLIAYTAFRTCLGQGHGRRRFHPPRLCKARDLRRVPRFGYGRYAPRSMAIEIWCVRLPMAFTDILRVLPRDPEAGRALVCHCNALHTVPYLPYVP